MKASDLARAQKLFGQLKGAESLKDTLKAMLSDMPIAGLPSAISLDFGFLSEHGSMWIDPIETGFSEIAGMAISIADRRIKQLREELASLGIDCA